MVSIGAGIVARDKVAAQKEAEIGKLKPRTLSDAQRVTLIEKLKGQHIGMVTPLMDGEARDYAEALGAALRAAGWDVAPINGQSLNTFAGYVVLGPSDARMGTVMDHVAAALHSIDIEVRAKPLREEGAMP